MRERGPKAWMSSWPKRLVSAFVAFALLFVIFVEAFDAFDQDETRRSREKLFSH
jgi:hypothetical protein